MTLRWFQLEDFYGNTSDGCVFYPHLYARGYRFSDAQRTAMDDVLGPYLRGRMYLEFAGLFLFVSFTLMVVGSGFLVTASREQLDAVLGTSPWVWLVGALALAATILIPVLFRLQSKIRHQLSAMRLEPSEPPRPDFFVVMVSSACRGCLMESWALGASFC